MKYPRLKIAIAILITLTSCLTYFWCFPIMEVIDGCECGHHRKWYEMPNSPWANADLFKRSYITGDPNHKHLYWDAQWGVWFMFPWQK